MDPRTIEDRLREEYFGLISDVRRAADELEAEVRYLLIPALESMETYERLTVKSRVKECESAIGALRRRQEYAAFDKARASHYSLRALNDLAGVRILAFPKCLVLRVDALVRVRFSTWTSDPISAAATSAQPLALKYHGYCQEGATIRAELQIVPMLIGMFWEVEHAALYKPAPNVSGIEKAEEMQQRNKEVIGALEAFEEQFETLARATIQRTGVRPSA